LDDGPTPGKKPKAGADLPAGTLAKEPATEAKKVEKEEMPVEKSEPKKA